MRIIKLPCELIYSAFRERFIAALHIYLLLKAYKNEQKPIYFNFSYKTVAISIRVSESTLRRNVKALKELGLVSIVDGNLCLLGLKKLLIKYKSKTIIHVPLKRKQGKLCLAFSLIEQNHNEQKNNIKSLAAYNTLQKKIDRNQYVTPKEYERLRKLRLWLENRRMQRFNVNLSVFGYGKILSRTHTTGKRIRDKMVKEGMIKVEKQYQHCGIVSLRTFCDYRRKGVIEKFAVWKDGIILTPIASKLEITFNRDSVKVKKPLDPTKMSYRQFCEERKNW